jgi:uncharacterized protein YdeI (YjbR/CyaY-like superfamily)
MNSFLEVNTLYVTNRDQWRSWLEKNHEIEKQGVWLVYYKQLTGKPTLEYNESVEEALCFGWVDSLIKKLDEEKYARKFTPRKAQSHWSESNRKRVADLLERGLMTEHGMKCIDAARASGLWEADDRPRLSEQASPEFVRALAESHAARVYFDKLTDKQRGQFILWINEAKQELTKRRRVRESISLLEQGRQLGMK